MAEIEGGAVGAGAEPAANQMESSQARVSRRALLRRVAYASGGTFLAGSGLLGYGTAIEPGLLEITRVNLALPHLPRSFAGLTIAQIGDLHLGQFVSARQVRAAADAVIGLKPDLAVITGDLVSRLGSGEAESIVQELSRLSAPLGVFAILGNHDHWTEAGVVAAAIRSAGLTLLRNASVLIERAGERIYIAGVDDIWEKRSDLPLALRGVPAEGCAILLAHEPDFADEASLDRRVALQLSGHSHGGQVRIPGLGPLQLPFLGQKYPQGLRRVGTMHLYTNRGIGVIFPPLRLNCRPEVTLFELTRGYGLGVKG